MSQRIVPSSTQMPPFFRLPWTSFPINGRWSFPFRETNSNHLLPQTPPSRTAFPLQEYRDRTPDPRCRCCSNACKSTLEKRNTRYLHVVSSALIRVRRIQLCVVPINHTAFGEFERVEVHLAVHFLDVFTVLQRLANRALLAQQCLVFSIPSQLVPNIQRLRNATHHNPRRMTTRRERTCTCRHTGNCPSLPSRNRGECDSPSRMSV